MQGIKKNCFDWKRWLQESSISVRGKSNLWGYELLLITVCILVLYGNIRINASGGVWCGGDSLVVMDDVFTKIFLTPFFLYLLNFLLRDDMRIQVILREQGKRILWGKFMFKTMLASVCFTVNVFLITFFFSTGMGFELERRGIFFLQDVWKSVERCQCRNGQFLVFGFEYILLSGNREYVWIAVLAHKENYMGVDCV